MPGPTQKATKRKTTDSLFAYVEMAFPKTTDSPAGISESTSRQRVSQLIRRVGAVNAVQAVWRLRQDLDTEGGVPW